MEIKICGPGCAKCDESYDLATRILQQKGSGIALTKVTDFQEIALMGIFSTPAVVIDDQVKCVGRVPTEQEFAEWLG